MALRSSSPASSPRRRRGGIVRRIERCCSRTITSLPLAFVYGLTSWAVYAEVSVSIAWARESRLGYLLLFLGPTFYILLNWSYTVACFADPGSPSKPIAQAMSSARHGYSYLPTHEHANTDMQSLTVKSSGGARFCKKCQCKKPDRAHHCSSCGRCVLKMDHHCPWLATCVGFRNYKPFLLFCSYVTIFCWVCFGVSGTYMWTTLLDSDLSKNAVFGINTVLLVVLSGIFGLVLTGFTGWHFSLAWRNQTTIECLEKTRYMTPIRKGINRAHQAFDTNPGEDPNMIQRYGQQLTEMHANAIPGVTAPEEGEERPSPAVSYRRGSDQLTAVEALRMSYNDMERQRERQRYENYLDEKDSEKLPHAFDLGWKKNMTLLFGDQKLLWLLPICNSIGDGWHWEPSSKWLAERDRMRSERDTLMADQSSYVSSRGTHHQVGPDIDYGDYGEAEEDTHYFSTSNGIASVPGRGRRSPGKANQILGRSSNQYADDYSLDGSNSMPLRSLKPRSPNDDTSSIDGIYEEDQDYEHEHNERIEADSERVTQEEWDGWE